uniref:NADH dehydrogenase subunit 6 n=1 Tax=Acrobeloides nanus TaxID=290746 RepID=A0A914E3U3_9BILA
MEIGILTNRCPKVNFGGSSLCDQIGSSSQSLGCISKYDFEKYCVAAMFIAIIFNIVIIVLTILSFIVIRHEKVPLVLAILAIISTLFIFTVVIVYPAKGISTYKDSLKGLGVNASMSMEYSYYLTVFSLILMIIASIVGCLMARESFSN